jgi:hypothetical protein
MEGAVQELSIAPIALDELWYPAVIGYIASAFSRNAKFSAKGFHPFKEHDVRSSLRSTAGCQTA